MIRLLSYITINIGKFLESSFNVNGWLFCKISRDWFKSCFHELLLQSVYRILYVKEQQREPKTVSPLADVS